MAILDVTSKDILNDTLSFVEAMNTGVGSTEIVTGAGAQGQTLKQIFANSGYNFQQSNQCAIAGQSANKLNIAKYSMNIVDWYSVVNWAFTNFSSTTVTVKALAQMLTIRMVNLSFLDLSVFQDDRLTANKSFFSSSVMPTYSFFPNTGNIINQDIFGTFITPGSTYRITGNLTTAQAGSAVTFKVYDSTFTVIDSFQVSVDSNGIFSTSWTVAQPLAGGQYYIGLGDATILANPSSWTTGALIQQARVSNVNGNWTTLLVS